MLLVYLTSLYFAFAIQMIFFAFAALFKTDVVTDLSYGLTFILIAWYHLLTQEALHPTQIVLATLITVWGVRLVAYLFSRILTIKKDARFDGTREDFWKFLRFWLLQALSVWVIMLPSIAVLSAETTQSLSMLSVFGIGVFLLGLTIETIADWQKFRFKNKSENRHKLIMSGIWKYSRHPNYFGEMLVWWGIFIFCVPLLTIQTILITAAGPLFITGLLLFVSGIPLLEKKYDAVYADDAVVKRYRKSTSLLVPLPQKN